MGDTDAALQERRRRLGKRIARLREARGYSQGRFAEKAQLGKSWLSMAENGQLNPSPKKLHQIAEALEVPLGALTADADVEGAESPLPLADLAYHRGRVLLASVLAQREDDWARGRRMLAAARELAEVMAVEPLLGAGAPEGDLEPRSLPEATRWLLLIELALCDPFAPFEFDRASLRPRTWDALPEIAAALDLPSEAVPVVREALDRRAALVEPPPELAPGPAGAVLDRAAATLVAPLLRGRDLVGWAGWSVAGGLYLARGFDPESPVTSTAEMTLPAWRDGDMLRSMAGLAVGGAVGALFAASPGPLGRIVGFGSGVSQVAGDRRRRREGQEPRPEPVHWSRADVADFLLALGPRWAVRELGKLAVTVDVVVRPGRSTDPDVEPCPDVETIVAALRAVAVDLEERAAEEARLNDPETPRLLAVQEILRAVTETAAAITPEAT